MLYDKPLIRQRIASDASSRASGSLSPHDAHLNRQTRPEASRHNIVSALAHSSQLIEHGEYCWTGRVAEVLVYIEGSADMVVGEMQCLLCALEDCGPTRVESPVVVRSLEVGERLRFVGGESFTQELVEHWGDGADGCFGYVFSDGCYHAWRGVLAQACMLINDMCSDDIPFFAMSYDMKSAVPGTTMLPHSLNSKPASADPLRAQAHYTPPTQPQHLRIV
jgi:hypothetical protein